jgi:N-hydroxyarylamine O-acetyltransferase
VDVDALLARIGYGGSREPTAENLAGLHRAFLLAVPFENLDIHLGRSISLDLVTIFEKIVTRRRGGFCYECNGLFAELLASLGYPVARLSARMALGGNIGPEFDHMVLLVTLDREMLADVGNGQSFRDPLPLSSADNHAAEGFEYRVGAFGQRRAVYQREDEGDWSMRFQFTTDHREQYEFAGMCEHHQTSSQSIFTKQRLVTRPTPEGRVTLTGSRRVEIHGGERSTRELASEGDVDECLQRDFGIELE